MKSTPYPDALTGRPKTPDPDFSIKKPIKFVNQINKLPFFGRCRANSPINTGKIEIGDSTDSDRPL